MVGVDPASIAVVIRDQNPSEQRWSAMGTLLAPDMVLTTAHAVVGGEKARIVVQPLGTPDRSVPARVLMMDEAQDLALLALETPVPIFVPVVTPDEPPPRPGDRWQSVTVPEVQPPPFMRAEGRVEFAGFDALSLVMDEWEFMQRASGAPIIVSGRLVGIMQALNERAKRYIAINLQLMWKSSLASLVMDRLSRSPVQGGSQRMDAEEPTPGEGRERHGLPVNFIQRMGNSTHAVLRLANGMRMAQGRDRLHMEHLVGALFRHDDKELTRNVLARSEIGEGELAEIFSAEKVEIPPLGRYAAQEVTSSLPLSRHAVTALEYAMVAYSEERAPRIESHHLLYGVLSVEQCRLIRRLLGRGVRREHVPVEADPAREARQEKGPQEAAPAARAIPQKAMAGYHPDDLQGEDLLGIHREVDALVSVVAAEDVQPPISLGLFGDWGSGKSFFMQKMEERIRALMKDKARGYCQNIVQIRFNAWHYIDTQNLWASFAAEIFEQLAQKLAERDGESGLTERARLLAAAASSRNVLAEAQTQKEAAEKRLQSSEELLLKLEESGAEIDAGLTERALYRSAFQKVLQTQLKEQELSEKLTTAAEKLQIPLGPATVDELKKLVETPRFLKAFWVSITSRASRQRQRFLVLTLIALVVPILVGLVASRFADLGRWLPVVAPLIGLLLRCLPYMKMAQEALAPLKTAHEQTERQLGKEKERQRAELMKQKGDLMAKVLDAQRQVEEAAAAVHKIEEQIDAIQADRQMADFIRQRHASTDYTQHLGVIARAHQDFERLSKLLQEVRQQQEEEAQGKDCSQAGAKPKLPRIDRIILYVDDLDRCPEDKVVGVLQAVHLLLAFELFVVVVGVDSRWLLHSLQQHSRVFQASLQETSGMSAEDQHHWQSTPLNYLEKIFQIPYALQPMRHPGFAALVDDLTKTQKRRAAVQQGAGKEGKSQAAVSIEAAPGGGGGAAPGPAQVGQPAPTGASRSTTSPVMGPATTNRQENAAKTNVVEPVSEPSPEPPPEPPPEPLQFQPWERDFMKDLHVLIPSPRAAKRFVNTYRLLHASQESADRAELIGDETKGGHRPALLLLAMLIGHPTETAEILETLIEKKLAGTWWAFIDSFEKHRNSEGLKGQGWGELLDRLKDLRKEGLKSQDPKKRDRIALEQPLEDFRKWGCRVARYSFHARAVLLAERDAAATPEDPRTKRS